MSILKSIWNGPFYIGKLAQPVSVGDVLLKIMEVLWRGIITIVGLLLGVAAAIAGYIYVITPVFFPPAKESLEASAAYTAGNVQPPPLVSTVIDGAPTIPSKQEFEQAPCDPKYPVRVTIYNNGDKPVSKMRFYLEGYQPNLSTNFVDQIISYTSDSIIRPGHGWSNCYSVNTRDQVDPKKLSFKVDLLDAAFVEE